MRIRIAVVSICAFVTTHTGGLLAANSDSRQLAAYIHIPQCFDEQTTIAEREQAIEAALDQFQALGLKTIVPYATTTGGVAHYPSTIITERRYGDWDPVGVFVRGARQRSLDVHLCIPVLNSGHAKPAGILKQHPDWALRDSDGQPVGGISPGHPQARKWVVQVLEEITDRYQPDGLLLDYLRYPSMETQFEPHSAARFAKWREAHDSLNDKQQLQQFREQLLTELAAMISGRIREKRPDLHLAIYSWGHHVTSGHRVGQAWPQWAAKGYIDEVNVCGYWYPDSYPARWGKTHLEAFRTVLGESRRLLEPAAGRTKLTFALGVKTSHGRVQDVAEIADYLREADQMGADGATFFTWSYLEPFLPQLETSGVLKAYAAGRPIPQSGQTHTKQGARNPADPTVGTLLVATKDSSETARQTANFVGDGTGDQAEINAAIAALPAAGGTVLLAEGTYDIRKIDGKLGGVLIERSNVVLAGRGPATKLILAPDQNTNVIRIIGSGVHHVTIRDLYVDANRAQNSAGKGDPNISHDRFEFCGIKGYRRAPGGTGNEDLRHITVRNCEVRNAHRLGIMLEGVNLRVLDNILGNAGSDSVELLTGPGMIRGNYVEITGQTHVAIGSDRGNSIQMSDNVVHVRKGGALDIGFRSWADSQRHVINGNVLIVDPGGRCTLAMDLRGQMQTVTGNTVEDLNAKSPTRIRIGGGNTILSGNTLKNVIIEVNDTYGDEKPIVVRDNILDNSRVNHKNGDLQQ